MYHTCNSHIYMYYMKKETSMKYIHICRWYSGVHCSSIPFYKNLQEGPATHLCLVLILCTSYDEKCDLAGPSRWNRCGIPLLYERKCCHVAERSKGYMYSTSTPKQLACTVVLVVGRTKYESGIKDSKLCIPPDLSRSHPSQTRLTERENRS